MGLFGFGKKLSPEEAYSRGMKLYQDEHYGKALSLLEQAAEQGHAEAQYQCGKMYGQGWGVEKDRAKALYWYEKAAGQGHVGAQSDCGYCYMKGLGTAADQAKGLMWYEKAAGQGYAKAQLRCGEMYDKGEGTAVDKAKARMWYEKAAREGSQGVSRRAKAALDSLNAQAGQTAPTPEPEAPAAAEDLDALLLEGLAAYRDKDYAKAFALVERIAQQGDATAQSLCGRMYEEGEGTEKDKAKALYWYEKAAEQGDVDAQYKCGVMYDQGEGTLLDEAKAFMWYEKAARQGHAKASMIWALSQSIERPLLSGEKTKKIEEKLVHHMELTPDETEYLDENFELLPYSVRGLYDAYIEKRMKKDIEEAVKKAMSGNK